MKRTNTKQVTINLPTELLLLIDDDAKHFDSGKKKIGISRSEWLRLVLLEMYQHELWAHGIYLDDAPPEELMLYYLDNSGGRPLVEEKIK